jgi:uncharacterized RDD family membrane protein YckC
MPTYDWICHVCAYTNAANINSCARCGSPAVLSGLQISRIWRRLAGREPVETVVPSWIPENLRGHYPALVRRYIGSLIDFVFLITLIGLVARAPFYAPSHPLHHLGLLAIFVVYEPFLTCFFCTLGQALMRFRVRDLKTGARIPLWRSYIRLVTKCTLGLVSFVTLPARSDRRAIHDLVANTIVVESELAKGLRALTPVRVDARQAARRST